MKGLRELQQAKAPHRGGYALNLACYALEAVPEGDPLHSVLQSAHELPWTLGDAWLVKKGAPVGR